MKSRISLLPLLALLLGVTAFAQQAKLAIIDMQGALLTTKEGQKAAAELKTKFSPTEQALNKRQQDLQTMQAGYSKTQATMTAADKAKMERDIDVAQKALTRDADDARTDFQAAQNQLLGGIMQKMQAVLNKYAADNAITLLVDVSTQPNNLLYADKSTNISAQIVELFDSGAVAPPAPKPAAARPAGPAAPKPAPKAPGAK